MPAKHFVAYHNADQRGAYRANGKTGGSFETNKTSRPIEGNILWCFEGAGSPKKYRLMARGLVTHVTKRRDGTFLVHYKSSKQFEPVDVTRRPWFQKLKSKQGSFAFGLNAVGDTTSINKLESCIARKEGLNLEAAHEGLIEPQSNSIGEMARRLIPHESFNEVLEAVAASVLYASNLDPTKWGIRINKHTIMLKVGFVETLQVGGGTYYLLVEKKHVPLSYVLAASSDSTTENIRMLKVAVTANSCWQRLLSISHRCGQPTRRLSELQVKVRGTRLRQRIILVTLSTFYPT